MSDVLLILNCVYYSYHAREMWRLEPGRLPRAPHEKPRKRKRSAEGASAPLLSPEPTAIRPPLEPTVPAQHREPPPTGQRQPTAPEPANPSLSALEVLLAEGEA